MIISCDNEKIKIIRAKIKKCDIEEKSMIICNNKTADSYRFCNIITNYSFNKKI